MFSTVQDAIGKVADKLQNWLESFILLLPNLVVAILVLLVFWGIAKLVNSFSRKYLPRLIKNNSASNLLIHVVYFSILAIGLFIALEAMNLDKTVTSLLAGIGILGIALGFAFKDITANFLSGIYLAVKSPVNEGDIIEYEDYYGVVKNIDLRATTITSMQGQDVVIPNRLIVEQTYVHYTSNKTRRIDLSIGISYGDDLEKAEKITLAAIRSIDYLLPSKDVDLFYEEFGDSSINFVVRYWIAFNKETDYLKALSDGIKKIKKAYDENDITITFPIRTLDFGMKGGKTLSDMWIEMEKLKPKGENKEKTTVDKTRGK